MPLLSDNRSIRPLSPSEFPDVVGLFLETFPAVDDRDFTHAWNTRDSQSSMGLYYKATLIGFGLVAKGKLWFLTVTPAHRGGGAGTHLLKAIMDTRETLALCPVNEKPVIEWYKRHGFVISKTMPFIHHDIPIYMMVWTSTPEQRASSRSFESLSLESQSCCGSESE